ncbi:choice-of-anchor D domain-containing protein [Flavobacterium ajazii]|uniref:choice-of-anchor D domain-containing protein n=1 Tax=Flavobacterium ajazii TaxID=2692318 RepID=UPI0013D04BF9|nr:choice-of-anchor D domain-containing protein [Flavobacterium ajazii]
MKSKRILALAITIFWVKFTIGQNYHKDVVPPDPVSAQFQKYLGFPVSTATGIPEINIPLYTMEASGVSIPFSLSYHASGIKVNEATGIIGLGWSLYPGFKITRTIVGNPDDTAPTNDIRTANSSLNDPLYLNDIAPHTALDNNFGVTPGKDAQYDIFSVHLPNANATFILEWVSGTLKATTIPQSSLDIRVLGVTAQGRFSSFEITDENGVIYKFGSSLGNSEYIEYTDRGITSWMLTEIDPPGNNNSVIFHYENSVANVGLAELVESLVVNDMMDCGFDNNQANCSFANMAIGQWDGQTGYSVIYPSGHYDNFYTTRSVSTIEYNTGESISFDYSEGASTNDYDILDKITFRNHEGNAIKIIQLEKANKQLTKLLISGENAYEFFYDQQQITNFFKSQDFLGLYNGKPNTSLFPKMTLDVKTSWSAIGDRVVGYADRSFDPVKSQARILKNIIYPTGGQTSFEYEPNSYQTDEGVSCGMGLRIKQINTYDPVSNKTMVKSYKYGHNESGAGNLTMSFLKQKNGFSNAFLSENQHTGHGARIENDMGGWDLSTLYFQNYRERIISAQSNYSSFEPNVWYDEVTEYSNEGKTVFEYEYTPSTYLDTQTGKDTREYFKEVLRNLGTGGPRLINKTIKNNNDTVLEHTDYQYSYERRWIAGLMTFPNHHFFGLPYRMYIENPLGTTMSQFFNANVVFNPHDYFIEINNDKLISTIQTSYNHGSPVTTETSFVYDDTYTFNLKSKSLKTSTGDVLTEKYYYTVGDAIPDLGIMTGTQQAMVATLASNNYRTTILEKETLKNNMSISKELFGYKNWGNAILKPEQIYAKKEGGNFDSRYFYHGYDDKGNVLEVSKANDSHTFYIWGYNKRYPIAKIDNFESSQITTSIQTAIDAVVSASNVDNDRTIGTAGQEGILRSATSVLRTLLPNSMITSYTYDPLVGTTSKTDPKGNINYFDYNSDNKLKTIKDDEGNYLMDYKYNYVPTGTYSPIIVPAYSGDLNCGGGQTFFEKLTYSVSNQNLSFGNAPVGSSSLMNFSITNTSPVMYPSLYININSIQLPSGFSLVSPSEVPFSLLRGESKTLAVSFNPTDATAYSGIASINSNATGPQINLSGTGTAVVGTGSRIMDIRYNGTSISNLDFGTVSRYNDSTKTIQIYNTGNSTLNVSSIVSSDFWTFTLAGPFYSGAIAPGGHKDFDVVFHNAGSESGFQSATITINSDRTNGNNILNVSGTLTE